MMPFRQRVSLLLARKPGRDPYAAVANIESALPPGIDAGPRSRGASAQSRPLAPREAASRIASPHPVSWQVSNRKGSRLLNRIGLRPLGNHPACTAVGFPLAEREGYFDKARITAWLVGCLIFASCLNGFTIAAEPPSQAATSGEEVSADAQDLLLLGPLEPTRLRCRIEVDGEPFQAAWVGAFNRLFDRFDVDRDGRLTPEQAAQMANIFGANLTGNSRAKKSAAGMMEMMSKSELTRDDLQERFEQSTPPLKLVQKLSSGGAGPALVPLLDTDGDGRLSRDELSHAAQSLHCRDFDDDQLITEQELVAGPVLTDVNTPSELAAGDGSVILLTRKMDAAAVAEILLSRYDRNRDGVLSLRVPAEVQSEAGNLTALDTDGDQVLTRNELRGYLNLPHDAELPFVLGGSGAKKKGTAAPQYRLRSKLDGGFRLQVGTREINFRRTNRNPKQDENRIRLQDFDMDSNGSLDATEFANITDKPEFAVVDTDKDEKISVTEFDAFFQQRARIAAVQLLLEATEQGADLFRSLDQNGDRVLTPRELLCAPQLLETDDQDHDGYLGGAEMSYNLVIELSRGSPRVVANPRPPLLPRVKADRTGPAWFLKMDRNRDGDVGLPEFPGSRQSFANLDTNGDGLLSAEEATAGATEKKRSE